MRVLMAGTPTVAVPTLDELLRRGHDVVGVLTQPDARARRGKGLIPSPLKQAALERGLPVLTPERASAPEVIAQVREWQPEVAAVVAYGQLLRRDLLDAVEHGWINLHFSLLPQWRGAAPVQRAIMAGDTVTGASTFVIEEDLDTGPVLGLMTQRIGPRDTAGDLLDRLAHAGAPLLVDSVEGWVSGALTAAAQSHDGVSYAAKLSRDDAWVNWERPAHVIDRQIRGCTPNPGAWTTVPGGHGARLGPVTPTAGDHPAVPGQVAVSGDQVLVGTGTAPVALSTITPAGKREMDAASWARGARLDPASRLGDA